jgi:hypothetical protein
MSFKKVYPEKMENSHNSPEKAQKNPEKKFLYESPKP